MSIKDYVAKVNHKLKVCLENEIKVSEGEIKELLSRA